MFQKKTSQEMWYKTIYQYIRIALIKDLEHEHHMGHDSMKVAVHCQIYHRDQHA